MTEVVFFHRATRTVILGDLIENHDPRLMSPVQQVFARFNRMLAPRGETPRNFRLSFVRRSRARDAVERILAWEPRHVILMHGPCVRDSGTAFLRYGLRWLRPSHGGSIATKAGLVFIGATFDRKFRAFDSETGEILWEVELNAAGFATPCSYEVDGKQFVVIAAGGGKGDSPSGDEYVAFALG